MAPTHLLDTNTCIYIINRHPPQVAERFAEYPADAIGLSSITLAELRYGVSKSGSAKNATVLEAFIEPLEVLPFGTEATLRYGLLRAKLERLGKPIGAMDLLIAAHALSLGAILVTNNMGEFERVEGLKLANWF